MSRTDFEHVIRKDIRNNPIVREIDQARLREIWRSVGIGVFLVAVLLFSAWQHFEVLRHGYAIEQMQQKRVHELEINRHLRLEIETLRSPKRIERIAVDQLKMVTPTADDAFVLQLAEPAPIPDSSIVATHHGEDTGGR